MIHHLIEVWYVKCAYFTFHYISLYFKFMFIGVINLNPRSIKASIIFSYSVFRNMFKELGRILKELWKNFDSKNIMKQRKYVYSIANNCQLKPFRKSIAWLLSDAYFWLEQLWKLTCSKQCTFYAKCVSIVLTAVEVLWLLQYNLTC